ncbi:hypothetical protein SB758_32140, partial [Burkholderia sp. SIMBA_013]
MEIAQAVLFLAGDDSRYMMGAEIAARRAVIGRSAGRRTLQLLRRVRCRGSLLRSRCRIERCERLLG